MSANCITETTAQRLVPPHPGHNCMPGSGRTAVVGRGPCWLDADHGAEMLQRVLCAVQVWDLSTMECTNTWAGHTKAILKLQLQGKYIFSIGGPSIRVWNKTTGVCVHRILTPRRAGWVRAISVNPDLGIVAGCQDTTLRQYRFAPDAARPPLLGLQSVASCPRGPEATGGPAAAAAAAAVEECRERCGSDTHAPPSTLIAPVGTGVAGGASKARATFDVSKEAPFVTEALLEGKLDEGHCAAIHAVVSGRRFVCSAGGDSGIRVWRADSLEAVTTMTGHRGPVFALLMLGVDPSPLCSRYHPGCSLSPCADFWRHAHRGRVRGKFPETYVSQRCRSSGELVCRRHPLRWRLCCGLVRVCAGWLSRRYRAVCHCVQGTCCCRAAETRPSVSGT